MHATSRHGTPSLTSLLNDDEGMDESGVEWYID